MMVAGMKKFFESEGKQMEKYIFGEVLNNDSLSFKRFVKEIEEMINSDDEIVLRSKECNTISGRTAYGNRINKAGICWFRCFGVDSQNAKI